MLLFDWIRFRNVVCKRIHMSEFKGKTIGIDVHCWMSRGNCQCGFHASLPKDRFIEYCTRKLQYLMQLDIKPVLVFDGRNLSQRGLIKIGAVGSMVDNRDDEEYDLPLRERTAPTHDCKNAAVSHEMIRSLIETCRQFHIDYIVAPDHAAAQLTFFESTGLIDYILSDESSVLLYGACAVIFKMDSLGNAYMAQGAYLYKVMKCKPEEYTYFQFLYMCILGNMFYFGGYPRLYMPELRLFMHFVVEKKVTDVVKMLETLPEYFSDTSMRWLYRDPVFLDQFLAVVNAFLHMCIYNIEESKMKRLRYKSEKSLNKTFNKFCGNKLDDRFMAQQLALGNLNVVTMQPIDDWFPDNDFLAGATMGTRCSIWASAMKFSN